VSAAVTGLGLGIVASLLFFYLVNKGSIEVDRLILSAQKSGLSDPSLYLGLSFYWIFINSLIEELVWRWFLYRNLKKYLTTQEAIFVSALGFTLHHWVALYAQFTLGWSVVMSLGVLFAGAVFAWIYERRQSLLPAYICHLILDIPIFVFGYWLIFVSTA
jgi:uncharacterized protein